MSQPPRRIYLDNAATSWPKPPEVIRAVETYLRENGAPAGRGAYREALEVESLVQTTRSQAARFIGSDHPASLIFTSNGTDSLNQAIHGVLRDGDHVVTTAAEHNSVLRPLEFLRRHRQITFDVVPVDRDGWVEPDAIASAIRPETRLIAVTHASNVTGVVQPIEAIGEIARSHGVLFLVDAAQSIGHLPLDVARLDVDLLAASAHKGLLGILGLGILYIRPGLDEVLLPLRQGGTGTRSDQIEQPRSMPDRYESGNLNVPGIVALNAALNFHKSPPVRPSPPLAETLVEGLRKLERVRVIGWNADRPHVEVVSVVVQDWQPADVAAVLDAQFGIQVRAGFHCAPLIHAALATETIGGTLRFSFGPFNTEADVDVTLDALKQLATCST